MRLKRTWRILLVASLTLAYSFGYAQNINEAELEDIEKISIETKPSANLKNESKLISLKDVLEEGLRLNSLQQQRRFQSEILDINWSDDYKDFWYPQLNLTINSDETLVDNLYGDVDDNNGASKTPNGYVGLEIENYTVFNWGKDYLEYQNSKETYKRQKEILKEQRRALRFDIISNYFNLVRLKKIARANKNQLRQNSFIYRLAKEKLSLKKVGTQQFLQAKSEFLKAHQEYQNSLFFVTEAEQVLAKSIGDDLETTYTPAEELKFKTLTNLPSTSYQFAQEKNPEFLTAKTKLNNANRSFQKALKENMPLPKFDVRFGALRHNFSDSGAQDTFETSPGNKNVELVASINMKWAIFGSGGLFNTNTDKKAYLRKRISEIEYRESKREVKVSVNTLHRKIRFLEKKYEASAALVKSIRKTFDKTLDNYIGSKTSFADTKLTLELMTNSLIEFENAKYEHLFYKLQLARLMGVDDFPGERFEGLVVR
jgi:outer membrane protein TolC